MAFQLVDFDGKGGYSAVNETEMNEYLFLELMQFTRTRKSDGKLDVSYSPLPYHVCQEEPHTDEYFDIELEGGQSTKNNDYRFKCLDDPDKL